MKSMPILFSWSNVKKFDIMLPTLTRICDQWEYLSNAFKNSVGVFLSVGLQANTKDI